MLAGFQNAHSVVGQVGRYDDLLDAARKHREAKKAKDGFLSADLTVCQEHRANLL